MLRATVFENGKSLMGKVLMVPSTLSQMIESIQRAFSNDGLTVIFSSKGGIIENVQLIRDDEVIYAAKENETFIPVPSRSFNFSNHEWISLCVGGQLFHVSRTTVMNEPNVLSRMFDPDSQIQPSIQDSSGAYLLDRDPKYFSPLLNYLRTGKLIIDPGLSPLGVREEAEFFGVQSCIPLLDQMLVPKDEAPLSRCQVVKALIRTSNEQLLRFQGVNLSGADLSYLDLRNINFKYAKLKGCKLAYCNLTSCNFERADLTNCVMNNCILSGVRMTCAVMEGAHCVNCNFQDPSGRNANMEGVNAKGACFEDSDLTNSNFRVACLKFANLKSTILRGAILAGADLEMCDLTGSDLTEANLRGANLKNTTLELMMNPLHMSQAIR